MLVLFNYGESAEKFVTFTIVLGRRFVISVFEA